MATTEAVTDADGASPYLRSIFAFQQYQLQNNPVQAHWYAGGCATVLGCALAAVRGLSVAVTQQKGLRMAAFIGVSRAAAPLYIIPFVLGSQLDCYEATWAREKAEKSRVWAGGGVADLG